MTLKSAEPNHDAEILHSVFNETKVCWTNNDAEILHFVPYDSDTQIC